MSLMYRLLRPLWVVTLGGTAVVYGHHRWQDYQTHSVTRLALDEGATRAALVELSDKGHRIGAGPVTVIMFSDYHCPACRTMLERLHPLLFQEHVPFSLRVVHALVDTSEAALRGDPAPAARCAALQDRFLEFHMNLLARDSTMGLDLRHLASVSGVPDLEEFERCRKSPQRRDELATNLRLANQMGVSGVPAFVFEGEEGWWLMSGVTSARQFLRILR